MATIAVRKEQNRAAAPPRDTEPSRVLRALFGWDPLREMEPFFTTPMLAEDQYIPAFDVKETREGFVLQADVPGVKEMDVSIQVNEDRITISGKRECEKNGADTFFTSERSHGSFSRSFKLPRDADAQKTQADLKDGVLSIFVPRAAKS